MEKLVISPAGCLLWTAYIDEHGYGRINDGGRMARVHRVMYEMFVGPIPADMEIDHLCRVRHCAAPSHLEAVTHKENGRRGESRPAQNARKSHCVAGHVYDEVNTYWRDTRRNCRACNREAARRYSQRRLATP